MNSKIEDKQVFRFKAWHFMLAIVSFYAVIAIISETEVRQIPASETSTTFLTELDELVLDDEGLSFVFLYRNDSELCRKMRHNVEQLAKKEPDHIRMYAMDIEKDPAFYFQHNVSGVPNILIFDGDKEIKRVMGVVSTRNLAKITERLAPL